MADKYQTKNDFTPTNNYKLIIFKTATCYWELY